MFYRFSLTKSTATLFLLIVIRLPAAAQKPVSGPPVPDAVTKPLHDYEQSLSRTAPPKKDEATAERRQRELTSRLADFANSWNKLVQLAEKGVWNAKQAAKTRKAFERLVQAEGWIEDDRRRDRDDAPSLSSGGAGQ